MPPIQQPQNQQPANLSRAKPPKSIKSKRTTYFFNTIDPKRTRGSAIAEAAFGSKADMGGQSRRVRYPTSLKECRQSEHF
jgi:hypothetical protein